MGGGMDDNGLQGGKAMNLYLAWALFAVVAVLLGAVGYHFSLRTLRRVTFVVAMAIVVYLPVYGLTHPARGPGSLSDAFARGADTLTAALIRPVSFGHQVPVPGRIGWLVIVVLLVLGYRWLEAWALRRQAPCLDVSALAGDPQDDAAEAKTGAQTGKQQRDWLVAELKFLLPMVEVRSPAILPGGSRSGGLASIAEATGVTGAGLAGAIIRFFGMVWPNPSRIQVRAWVERPPGLVSSDGVTRVTVGLTDPRSGARIAAKTLAAGTLDDAAAAVAGYVARHIFARDRTVPPWCTSATDGADLAALLRARQVRGYPECRSDIRSAWDSQIEILEGAAGRDLCAGVVRYELAQLHELCATRKPVEALLLHAATREQYPRFYRGRYRLAMSLEMLANPHFRPAEIDMTTLKEALRILDRCGVTNASADLIGEDQTGLPDKVRSCLLDAAWKELRAIHRYLTRRHIIWASFWLRNERAVLRPYWRPRHRQAFHDGVCVALLLVAVRRARAARRETRGQAAPRRHHRPDNGGHLRRQHGFREAIVPFAGQDDAAAAGHHAHAYPSLGLAAQNSLLASRVQPGLRLRGTCGLRRPGNRAGSPSTPAVDRDLVAEAPRTVGRADEIDLRQRGRPFLLRLPESADGGNP